MPESSTASTHRSAMHQAHAGRRLQQHQDPDAWHQTRVNRLTLGGLEATAFSDTIKWPQSLTVPGPVAQPWKDKQAPGRRALASNREQMWWRYNMTVPGGDEFWRRHNQAQDQSGGQMHACGPEGDWRVYRYMQVLDNQRARTELGDHSNVE